MLDVSGGPHTHTSHTYTEPNEQSDCGRWRQRRREHQFQFLYWIMAALDALILCVWRYRTQLNVQFTFVCEDKRNEYALTHGQSSSGDRKHDFQTENSNRNYRPTRNCYYFVFDLLFYSILCFALCSLIRIGLHCISMMNSNVRSFAAVFLFVGLLGISLILA